MLADVYQHIVANLAAIIAVGALAIRDQIKLRILLLVSSVLNVFRVFMLPRDPAWDDLFWLCIAVVINLFIIVLLVLDRTHVGLSDEEERLFQAFGSLTPGEFRRLLRLASWQTASRPTVLTEEGVRPSTLFYVLEGGIELNKSGRHASIEAPTFIGEVAFLKERTASATVRIAEGTRYLVWETGTLNRYFTRRQALRVAVVRLISADMALKVARA